MISPPELVELLRNQIRMRSAGCAAGLMAQNSLVPDYWCTTGSLPPICALSRSDSDVRGHCRRFYQKLPTGCATTICPFGMRVESARLEGSAGSFAACFVLACETGEATNLLVAELPRRTKKAVKAALEASAVHRFPPSIQEGCGDLFLREVETILAGNTVEAIRAISHQILTPVQGAISDLHALVENIDDSSHRGELMRRLDANINSLGRLSKRVAMLLANEVVFDRAQLRKVTVHKMVRQICDRLQSLAEEKSVVFNVGYNKASLTIEAIPDQLEIVLSVIIENALKYSFDGFADKQGRIEIAFEPYGAALAISIENFGCLIEEAEIQDDRIFRLGYRGKHSSDRQRRGTGSGLHIAHRIVHAHGGTIRVASKRIGDSELANRGVTRFTVIWPVYQES